MNKSGSSLFAALALTLLLAFAIPARAQDATQNTPDQAEPPTTPNASEDIQSAPQTAAPAATQQQPAKKKPPVHHKQKKKKPVHKTAKKKPLHKKKTKKPAKKKPIHKHKPVKRTQKQTKATTPKKDVEQEPLATEPGETEKEAIDKSETEAPNAAVPAVIAPAVMPPKAEEPKSQTKSEATEPAETAAPALAPAPRKSKLAAVKESIKNKAEAVKNKAEAAKNKVASVLSGDNKNGGSKTVTYTFCLGYDNCVPYRYEAMVHGGSVDAKIFKETPNEGGWNETKIDPVMNSDLASLAKSESHSDVMRPLTLTEKARIADHQGKAHADLVAAADSGNTEDLKRQMRVLGIDNENELEAYDPRLAKNDAAVAAANALATGR